MERSEIRILEGIKLGQETKVIDYESTLKANYDISLRSLQALKPDQIIFGPSYKTYASSGIYIRFDTYIDRYSDESKIVFFGFNQDDIPIAYRHSTYRSQNSYLVAHGYVAAAIKGQGLGTATELVHEDLLFRIAQIEGKTLVYETTNVNSRSFAEAILKYRNFISDKGNPLSQEGQEKFREIQRSEKEQDRWYSIFGPKGRFGYRTYCYESYCDGRYDTYKNFDPNDGPEDHTLFEEIDFIQLERLIILNSSGRLLYVPHVTGLQKGNQDELKEQKYNALMSYPFL